VSCDHVRVLAVGTFSFNLEGTAQWRRVEDPIVTFMRACAPGNET
jgi:hypothetical protein